jgi:uncharacterized protein (DUF1800 family)
MRIRLINTTFTITLAALCASVLMSPSHAQVANCPFNVDGTGTTADALRDGTVLVRYAQGVRDPAALVAGTGANAATVIAAITANIDRLDINGNGGFDSDDAAAILRVLFRYNTDAAAAAPKGNFAIRDTQAAVKTYLDGGCASTSLANNQRASKFLVQATFGPGNADINAFNAPTNGATFKAKATTWVNNQLNTPRSAGTAAEQAKLHFKYVEDYYADRCLDPNALDCQFGTNVVRHSFWKQALTGEDQLRQRMAFALSQIVVISDKGSSNDRYEVAAYLDFLNNNALGNYRDVIAGVVRSPAMGRFLSHLRNDGGSTTPNENFARELLQLFSVGQVKLNANGTPVAGNPSAYTEEVVKGFARTFTGMSYDDRRTTQRCINDPTETLPAWYWNPDQRCYPDTDTTNVADLNAWQRPMVTFTGFHSSADRKHLQYVPDSTDPLCSASIVSGTTNIVAVPKNATGDGTRVSKATADANIDKAITNVFCHPNVGPFIGKQLIRFFSTSTPSPEYVARVTAAFNNNGSNVRGDLKAVIRAILLDDEALDGAALATAERPKYGKLREPIMRLAHILRAFPRPTAASTPPAPAFSGRYFRYFIDNLDSVEYGLNQGPLQSATVFNFYHPEFAPPGPVQRANGTAPEFEITTTTAIASAQNYLGDLVSRRPYADPNPYVDFGFFGSSYPGNCDPYQGRYQDCIFMDYGELMAKWQSSSDLFDYINLVLLGGKLPASVKATYISVLDTTYPSNPNASQLADRKRDRVRVALWLAVHAPEFQVQY